MRRAFLSVGPALLATILSLVGCGGPQLNDPADDAVMSEDSSDKSDAVTLLGTYSSEATQAGDFTTLALMTTKSFHRETMVVCVKAPCPPVAQDGAYKLYKQGNTRYLRFLDDTGKVIDQYSYTLTGSKLNLRRTGGTHSFEMAASTPAWCGNPSDCENQGLIATDCVGDWTCEAAACAYTCAPPVSTTEVATWLGAFNQSETGFGYTPSANYDANNCEFYVDAFAKGMWSHGGATGSWIQADIAVKSQDGEILNTGMLVHMTDAQGVIYSHYMLGHTTTPNNFQTGFMYERGGLSGIGPAGELTDFSFFLDIQRAGGDIVRLWLSNNSQNYTLDSVFSMEPDHTESLGAGELWYANNGANVYTQKRACQ